MPQTTINCAQMEHHLDGGLTVMRRALSPETTLGIADTALSILVSDGWDLDATSERGFKASGIMPIAEFMPNLAEIAGQVLDQPLGKGTFKINYQEPGGKQGWHTDYVPEPLIIYPVGSGYLDFAPFARGLKAARALKQPGEVISVPVGAGDIAVVHHGGTIFHRGRNASDCEPRFTIVLH